MAGPAAARFSHSDQPNWLAVAMQGDTDAIKVKYLVVRGTEHAWADAWELRFN
jgi:hypothetical protein